MADDRSSLNAILYVLTTGYRWDDLQSTQYDHCYTTAWRRLKRWDEEGTMKRILDALIANGYYGDSQDGLALRPQHDDTCEKGGALIGYYGRKGINGTKIHVVVTARSLPVAVVIGSAREHEGRKLIPLMESVRVTGEGRPRAEEEAEGALRRREVRPAAERFYLAKKRILSQVKGHPGKKRRPGRPKLFDAETYGRVRSSVERFNAWVKSFMRVGTRYERLPTL